MRFPLVFIFVCCFMIGAAVFNYYNPWNFGTLSFGDPEIMSMPLEYESTDNTISDYGDVMWGAGQFLTYMARLPNDVPQLLRVVGLSQIFVTAIASVVLIVTIRYFVYFITNRRIET